MSLNYLYRGFANGFSVIIAVSVFSSCSPVGQRSEGGHDERIGEEHELSVVDSELTALFMINGDTLRYDKVKGGIEKDESFLRLIQRRSAVIEDLIPMLSDTSIVSVRLCGSSTLRVGSVAYLILEEVARIRQYKEWGLGYVPDCYDDCLRPCGFVSRIPYDGIIRDSIRKWISIESDNFSKMRREYPVISLSIGEHRFVEYDTYYGAFRSLDDDVLSRVDREEVARFLMQSVMDTSRIVVYNCHPRGVVMGVLYAELFMRVVEVHCAELFESRRDWRVMCSGQCYHHLDYNITNHPDSVYRAFELFFDAWVEP